MDDVYVSRWSHELGPVRESLAECEQAGLLLSGVSALADSGFATHFRCDDGTTAYDLASNAVKALKAVGPINAIVYACCLPINENLGRGFETTQDVKQLMVFPASRLQADFGLDNAFVVGLSQQACTGMLGSIRLARSLILSEELERVLCVTADRFPPGARYEQAYNLISDGAAACIVSRKREGYRIRGCHAITNGALSRAGDNETVGMFFNYMHRLVMETLATAKLTAAEITWVVPQNTNAKAWQILARLLGIPFERVALLSHAEVGHVISADNVINLLKLEASGRIKPGDILLLPMAGFGLNWQCLLLERV